MHVATRAIETNADDSPVPLCLFVECIYFECVFIEWVSDSFVFFICRTYIKNCEKIGVQDERKQKKESRRRDWLTDHGALRDRKAEVLAVG